MSNIGAHDNHKLLSYQDNEPLHTIITLSILLHITTITFVCDLAQYMDGTLDV